MDSCVYIIVLNYNGWEDTIECLESLLKIHGKYRIIICDNCSSDDSIEKLKKWSVGDVIASVKNDELKEYILPCYLKPLDIKILKYENGIFTGDIRRDSLITLICNEQNNGFSFGNNIGILYAKLINDYTHIWILNNDTIVQPKTLHYLLESANECEKIGIVGSVACDYYHPDVVQKIGSGFDISIMDTPIMGGGLSINNLDEYNTDGVNVYCGASFLMSRHFVENVGMLNDKHFLYFEEEDYTERAKRKGFKIAIAKKSIFYHKESVSTKKSGSAFMHYHFMRSMMIFLKDYYPNELKRLILYHACRGVYQILKFKIRIGEAIIKGIIDGLRA